MKRTTLITWLMATLTTLFAAHAFGQDRMRDIANGASLVIYQAQKLETELDQHDFVTADLRRQINILQNESAQLRGAAAHADEREVIASWEEVELAFRRVEGEYRSYGRYTTPTYMQGKYFNLLRAAFYALQGSVTGDNGRVIRR